MPRSASVDFLIQSSFVLLMLGGYEAAKNLHLLLWMLRNSFEKSEKNKANQTFDTKDDKFHSFLKE